MTTLAPDGLRNVVVPEWESIYPSATFSGIVGDLAHQLRGGYPISLADQPKANSSAVRPDDAAPPGNWSRKHATALDMSMSKADMVTSTRRWMAVWADRSDPRRIYFNAFNGWTGSGNAQRWDFVKNTVEQSTNDHQWHQHTERKRRYWNDPMADKATISIARGESKATWIKNNMPGGGTTPPDAGGEVHEPGSRELRLVSPQMTGRDVEFLQRYIGGGKLKIDGEFGPITEARVKWYQAMRGITVDGQVGKQTWGQMGVRVTY